MVRVPLPTANLAMRVSLLRLRREKAAGVVAPLAEAVTE
jgi:hypothetical protein